MSRPDYPPSVDPVGNAVPCGASPKERLRLSRDQRLRRRRDFDEVFGKGQIFPLRLFVLRVLRKNQEGYRLGVVVSRRVLRRAVDRNRAKRLVREAFRLQQKRFQGGGDLVIVVRNGITQSTRREVERELLRAAREAGLLKGSEL